jgi:hypothetical protein
MVPIAICPACGHTWQFAGTEAGKSVPCIRCGTDCILSSADDVAAEPKVRGSQQPVDIDARREEITDWPAASANPFQPPRHEGFSVAGRMSGVLDEADRVHIWVRLQAPGFFLAIFSILMICMSLCSSAFVVFAFPPVQPTMLMGIVIGALIIGSISVVTLIGSLKMRKLESYWFSIMACVLPMIPCFTSYLCIVALPLGTWGLIVLRNRQVRALFNVPQQEKQNLLASLPAALDLDESVRMQLSARLQRLSRYLTIFATLSLATVLIFVAYSIVKSQERSLSLAFFIESTWGGSSALVLFGARKMRKLKSYRLSVTSCILSMFHPFCFLVGLPLGIWGLTVLANPRVQSLFNTPHGVGDTGS